MAETTTGTKPLIKPLGLPVGVDSSPIKLRPLLLIAQQFIGRADFLKALHGFRVIPLGVRVVLLRERPERLLDFGFRRLARYAKHIIWITHTSLPFDTNYIGTTWPSR